MPVRLPYRSIAAPAAIVLLYSASGVTAHAQVQLITNGGFESGSLAGWTVTNSATQGANYDGSATASVENFYAQGNSGSAPVSGLYVLSPNTGTTYALADMTGPGESALTQSFLVPVGAKSVLLSFNMYVYDYYGAGGAVDSSGLDYTTGGSNPTRPNQYATVDLLTATSSAFNTTSGVLQNYYGGVDPEAAAGNAPVWRSYSFDITSKVTPGSTYKVRFGEVNNEFVLNQGVDNVRVLASSGTSATPELTSLPTFSIGLLFGGTVLITRRRKSSFSISQGEINGRTYLDYSHRCDDLC